MRFISCLVCLCALARADIRLERNSEGFEFSFRLDRIEAVRTTSHTEGTAIRLGVPGMETEADEAGELLLPRYTKLIPIPDGYGLRVEQLEVTPIQVSVSGAIAYQEHARGHCGKDVHVSRKDTPVRPWVELSEASYAGPVRVARLRVNPVRVRSNTIRTARMLRFRLRLFPQKSTAPIAIRRLSEESKRVYRALFLEGAPAGLQAQGRAPHDLVLVHPEFGSELSFMELLRLKQSEGRKVTVVYSASKSKTDEIKNIIRSHYTGSEPPTHTLLIGSIDHIPAYKLGEIWSDFPYTHLDSGELPDLSIGRMAVRTPDELQAMVAKIIHRADSIPSPQRVLVTSGYETGWCHKNLAFIQQNIFNKAENALDITRLYATEGHKTDSIINAYNQNPNFIIYDGHGTQKGMTEIPLLMEHLTRLSNSTYPVVFDIACLNSHWPSSGAGTDNFAQKLITLAGAGPAGLVAATSSGDAHDLFRFMFRAAIHDETGSTPFHRIHEMGSILYFGKLKYLESKGTSGSPLNDSRMFHYFGDPATRLF